MSTSIFFRPVHLQQGRVAQHLLIVTGYIIDMFLIRLHAFLVLGQAGVAFGRGAFETNQLKQFFAVFIVLIQALFKRTAVFRDKCRVGFLVFCQSRRIPQAVF